MFDNLILLLNRVLLYTFIASAIIIFLCVVVMVIRKNNNGKVFSKRVVKCTFRKNIHGIIYGKKGFKTAYSPIKEENHVVVYGGTGYGKTYHVLRPTLESWASAPTHDTFFALDIVERNTDITEINYSLADSIECPNKLIYEITSPQSLPYDIFYVVDQKNDITEKIAEIEKICEIIVNYDSDSAEQSTGNFFAQGALELLKGIMIHYYFQGVDFPQICNIIQDNDMNNLIFEVKSSSMLKAVRKINRFEKLIAERPSDFSGIADKVLSVTEIFADDGYNVLAKTIRKPQENEISFNPQSLEKYNVFFVIPDDKTKLSSYKIATKLIIQQCLDYFATRSTNSRTTILFAIDEYSTFNIDLTDALNKYRKRKVRILGLTQSLASLDLAVGELKRKTYLDNFKTKILLNVAEPDSQLYFSRMIGMVETQKTSKSENSSDTTYSTSDIKDYRVNPDYLGKMSKTAIIINQNGYVELRKFKNENFFGAVVDIIKTKIDTWLIKRA